AAVSWRATRRAQQPDCALSHARYGRPSEPKRKAYAGGEVEKGVDELIGALRICSAILQTLWRPCPRGDYAGLRPGRDVRVHSGTSRRAGCCAKNRPRLMQLVEALAALSRSFSSPGAAAILLFAKALDPPVNASAWVPDELGRGAGNVSQTRLAHGLLPTRI